jgi:hypothetical protein
MVRSREVTPGFPDSSVRPAVSGLAPYVPSASQPWDAIRAGHLLRRTTLMPRWTDIATILAMTPSAAVELLLNTPYIPLPPSIIDSLTEDLEGLDPKLQGDIRAIWYSDYGKLSLWYANVLRQAPLALSEKMTLFWSGHFTSSFVVDTDYIQAPLLYRQNKLFRESALGNFRNLVKGVTLDGAMLVYLGGNLNYVGRPNENYARELMELFTMGLGHYTEGDIQEAARILTGWRVARYDGQPAPNLFFNSYFDPATHDIDAKEFLGVSFTARDMATNTEFLVRRDEVDKLVDTIFLKRSREVAEFICRKIYRFFVYSNPADSDQQTISEMADLFIDSDFEIKPVMSALLKSAHFFDNANIGAQIKTPAELSVGMARQLDSSHNIAADMGAMDQHMFGPPNVSGWPGYREWITTTTYPVRSIATLDEIEALDESVLISFIRQFPNYTDVTKLTENIAALLLPRPLSTQRHDALEQKLLAGQPGYEWSSIINDSPSTAARNLRDMLRTLAALPDFQLC